MNDINALSHNDNLSAVTFSSNNIYLSDATNPNSSVATFKLCESTPANLNLYSESSQGHDNSHASQKAWNYTRSWRDKKWPRNLPCFHIPHWARSLTSTAESNLLMSNIQDLKEIPTDIFKKLQDNQMYLSIYLLQREEYITFLNDLVPFFVYMYIY